MRLRQDRDTIAGRLFPRLSRRSQWWSLKTQLLPHSLTDAIPQLVVSIFEIIPVLSFLEVQFSPSEADTFCYMEALLHDSTAARVGALFQLLVQDTTAQDFGLPSSAIRLRM